MYLTWKSPTAFRRFRQAGTLLLLLSFCAPAAAAPVYGKRMRLRQPDGTTVEVRIWGDEFHQIVESLDGYTLVRDPASKSICYARPSEDKRSLLSTNVGVGSRDPRSLNLKKHHRASADAIRDQVMAARAAYRLDGKDTVLKTADTGEPIPATTSTGDVRGICLLVDFADDPGTIPPSTANDFCNQPGFSLYGNNGSVHDYFRDVSLNHLNYTNHVPTQYFRAQFPKTYYDDPSVAYGTRARELILEALTALDASGFNFSQYDVDHNGIIDAINCLYAGTTTSGWATGLWPHAGTLSFTADGVSASRYQITDIGDELHLDTFCHENGHMLCNWPDLYDYDFDSRGVGRFCLMCDMASQTNPVQPCAYLKYVAGWADTTLLVTQQVGYTISPGQNQLYKFEHPTQPNEYYLIENRQQAGRDSALPDAGLALWHVDTFASNDNQQRSPLLHYKVTLVQADGRWDLEFDRNNGDASDLWKSPTYTVCGSQTIPNTDWWDGTISGLGLSDISTSGPPSISSKPADGKSLWRSQNNVIRLTSDRDLVAPSAGAVMIQEMIEGGTYGDDLSSGFVFTVENDGQGRPRVLKIAETGSMLQHRKWYAIRNTGAWAGVNDFTVQYAVQIGDADNDGQVLNADLSLINAGIPSLPAADDDRRDINGDGRILNADASAANARIPSLAVAKPTGHSGMSFTFGSSSILVNTTQIRHVVYPGTPLPDDTFTVTNPSTIIPMAYSLESTETWLTMTPDAGSALGETHTITVSYNNQLIPHWPQGTYGAMVTIRAPGAQNNPETLLVQVIIGSVGPDLDHDTDVDQTDFGEFQACMTGYGVGITNEACRKADFDKDDDVDYLDVNIFRRCLSGPDTQADLDCETSP